MIYSTGDFVDLATSRGPMRTHIYRPVADGQYPAVILYSEIYQITEPIRRAGEYLAGHGLSLIHI